MGAGAPVGPVGPDSRASRSAPTPSARRSRTGRPRTPRPVRRRHDGDHRRLLELHPPIRCSSTTRPVSGQRRRSSAAIVANRGTPGLVRLVGELIDAVRPSAWSRTVPLNSTTAPQSGRSAHSYAAATGSRGRSDRASVACCGPSTPGMVAVRPHRTSRHASRSCEFGPQRHAPARPATHAARDHDYARVLVEPAPLPPHERSWRHPSEIGPSRVEIAADGHGRRSARRGTLAALMVVVMVVAHDAAAGAGPAGDQRDDTPCESRTAASRRAARSSPPAGGAARVVRADPERDRRRAGCAGRHDRRSPGAAARRRGVSC